MPSRSSAGESAAVRRWRPRRAFKSRRDVRKVPLEWPATRLENGWAPQGVAFDPSTFHQHGCGRLQVARVNSHMHSQANTRRYANGSYLALLRISACQTNPVERQANEEVDHCEDDERAAPTECNVQ